MRKKKKRKTVSVNAGEGDAIYFLDEGSWGPGEGQTLSADERYAISVMAGNVYAPRAWL